MGAAKGSRVIAAGNQGELRLGIPLPGAPHPPQVIFMQLEQLMPSLCNGMNGSFPQQIHRQTVVTSTAHFYLYLISPYSVEQVTRQVQLVYLVISVTSEAVTMECQLTGENVLFKKLAFIFVTAVGGTRGLSVK